MFRKYFGINKYKIIGQFIKFGIVGLSNTMISLVVYYILIAFNLNYMLANTFSFFAGVVNSYYWGNKYVFKSKTETKQMKLFVKVFVSYGGSFLLSTIMMFGLVEFLSVSKYIAPILRLLVTVPLNFMFNKFWAYKDKS